MLRRSTPVCAPPNKSTSSTGKWRHARPGVIRRAEVDCEVAAPGRGPFGGQETHSRLFHQPGNLQHCGVVQRPQEGKSVHSGKLGNAINSARRCHAGRRSGMLRVVVCVARILLVDFLPLIASLNLYHFKVHLIFRTRFCDWIVPKLKNAVLMSIFVV